MPAEWQQHRATWLAWPSHVELWKSDLPAARCEFVGLCQAIAGEPDERHHPSEQLEVLVCDDEGERMAGEALTGLPARLHRIAFGDVWLRDTGPTFTLDAGRLCAVRFRFNGWGGKYLLDGDREVGGRIARTAAVEVSEIDLVLEGGAFEVDGDATCITTRQCALNVNRNPGVTEQQVEQALEHGLGAEKVIWLDRGLARDHTDGHVDTLARFLAPGVVACARPRSADDPNRGVLEEILRALSHATDARGRRLETVTLPSPGAVLDRDGELLAASYLNFYISNQSVVVPTYDVAADDDAVARLAECFPGRQTIGKRARAILTGGGAFHCITQQEPLPYEHGPR